MGGQRRSRSGSISMSMAKSIENPARQVKHGKKRKYGYKGEMVDPEQYKDAADTIVIQEQSNEDDGGDEDYYNDSDEDSSSYTDNSMEQASMSPPSKRRPGRPPKMRLQTLPRGSDVYDDMESPKSTSWTTKSRQYPMADAFQFPQIILRKPMSKETDRSPTKNKSNGVEMEGEHMAYSVNSIRPEISTSQPLVDSDLSPSDKEIEMDADTINDSIPQEQEVDIARLSSDRALSSAPSSIHDDNHQIAPEKPYHPANGYKIANTTAEVLVERKHQPTEMTSERPPQTIAPRYSDLNMEDHHVNLPMPTQSNEQAKSPMFSVFNEDVTIPTPSTSMEHANSSTPTRSIEHATTPTPSIELASRPTPSIANEYTTRPIPSISSDHANISNPSRSMEHGNATTPSRSDEYATRPTPNIKHATRPTSSVEHASRPMPSASSEHAIIPTPFRSNVHANTPTPSRSKEYTNSLTPSRSKEHTNSPTPSMSKEHANIPDLSTLKEHAHTSTPSRADEYVTRPTPSESKEHTNSPTRSISNEHARIPTPSRSKEHTNSPMRSTSNEHASRPISSKAKVYATGPTPSRADEYARRPTPSRSEDHTNSPTRSTSNEHASRPTSSKANVHATGPTPSRADVYATTRPTPSIKKHINTPTSVESNGHATTPTPFRSNDEAGFNESPRIMEPVVPSPSGMVIPAQNTRSKSRSPPKTSNHQHHPHLNGVVEIAPANVHSSKPPQPQPLLLPRLASHDSVHYPIRTLPPHHQTTAAAQVSSAPAHVSTTASQTPAPTLMTASAPKLSQLSDEHLQTIARQRMLQELKESEKADLIRRVEKVMEDIKSLREQRDESKRRRKDSDPKQQCQNCAGQPKKYLEPADAPPSQIYPAVPQYPPFGKRYEPEHIIPIEHQAGLRHFLHDLGASFAHWRASPQEPAFRGMMDVLTRFYGP